MEKDSTKAEKKNARRAGRSQDDVHLLINRLSRIEGQVRGIKGMLEKDMTSQDIMIQISAVNSALNALNKELLAIHVRTSFADEIRAGNDNAVSELSDLIKKVLK